MPFTKAELEEMRRADAEIEHGFHGLTREEADRARRLDTVAKGRGYASNRALAYYGEHREECLGRMRQWKADHAEQVKEYRRRYYREHGR